jgi:branched-chain amino acid transport system ATP-binding protein
MVEGAASAPRRPGLMALLRTENLTKAFGALTAVNRVTLAVEEGTLHSIIGPNGAGKTTLFNLLTGQAPPSAGRILFDGRDITGTPPQRIAHLGIARSFQRTNVFPALSVQDNVWVAVFARSPRSGLGWRPADRYPDLSARARAALGEVGLQDRAGQVARELSHGEQRQLELAIALAAAPRLLLLDEPAAGLSPDETRKMVALVRGLKGRYTIVLIEHKMDIIMTISDRVSVMHFGSLIAEGTPAEIQRNTEVRRAYLGGIAAP